MEEFRKIILTLIFACFTLIILIFLGIFLVNRFTSDSNDDKVQEITSRTIIEKIKDQYFVVTKTVYLDQETEIVVDEGSAWSNFFWGQRLQAEGLVRVDIGVNLNNLNEEDIVINEETKTVQMTLPQAEILDASLASDIEVRSNQGVFRRLFKNDPNSDFNNALEKLISEAKAGVNEDPEVFEEAHEDSTNLIRIIIENLGYTLEIVENE